MVSKRHRRRTQTCGSARRVATWLCWDWTHALFWVKACLNCRHCGHLCGSTVNTEAFSHAETQDSCVRALNNGSWLPANRGSDEISIHSTAILSYWKWSWLELMFGLSIIVLPPHHTPPPPPPPLPSQPSPTYLLHSVSRYASPFFVFSFLPRLWLALELCCVSGCNHHSCRSYESKISPSRSSSCCCLQLSSITTVTLIFR